MKKFMSFLLIVFVMLLVLSSCGTSVAVKTLIPAEVSLGKGDTIAIATPTVNMGKFALRNPKKGSDYPSTLETLLEDATSSTYSKLATYVEGKLEKALSGGLFTVVDSDLTEAYKKVASAKGKNVRDILYENGVDFVLTTDITDATYTSFISSKEVKSGDDIYTCFYLNQSASFTCVCMVQSVADRSVLDIYTFTGRTPSLGQYSVTEIARIKKGESGSFEPEVGSLLFTKDALGMLKEAADDLEIAIKNRLLPHYSTSYLNLKEDKTKDKTLANAYKLADNGSYEEALWIFLSNYRTTGYEVSGYNAATIYFALGQVEEAAKLAKDVFSKTGMADAVILTEKIERAVKSQQDALDQVNGVSKTNSSDLIGF